MGCDLNAAVGSHSLSDHHHGNCPCDRVSDLLVAKLQGRDSRKLVIKPETVAAPGANPHVANLEDRLREKFGTKVQLRYAKGKGAVEITFFSDEELERILQILGVSAE